MNVSGLPGSSEHVSRYEDTLHITVEHNHGNFWDPHIVHYRLVMRILMSCVEVLFMTCTVICVLSELFLIYGLGTEDDFSLIFSHWHIISYYYYFVFEQLSLQASTSYYFLVLQRTKANVFTISLAVKVRF
jgi:hypothetical protein